MRASQRMNDTHVVSVVVVRKTCKGNQYRSMHMYEGISNRIGVILKNFTFPTFKIEACSRLHVAACNCTDLPCV